MTQYRWRLLCSPTESNEFPSMELGLGNPRIVQELARLVRAQDPSGVFFIETWQDDGPLECLRCQLHFENKFIANSRNKGGGLCLFWMQEVKLRVHSFSPSHIDAIINESQTDS
jgi:hypothetical protein